MFDQLFTRQLEYFETLYRLRSYAAAARAIPITYQGLRKAIAKLESDLGVELFVSEADGADLEVTPYADRLHESVEQWMRDAHNLERSFASMREGDRSYVDICVVMGAFSCLGYSLKSEFERAHPHLRLRAKTCTDDAVDEALLSEEYGLGITCCPFSKGLVTRELGTYDCLAWVGRGHRLARRDALRLGDLAGEKLMIPESRYKAHRFFLGKIDEGLLRPRELYDAADHMEPYLFAKDEGGVGIFVGGAQSGLEIDDEVTQLKVEDGYPYQLGISYRRGHALTEAERCVYDFFVRRFA